MDMIDFRRPETRQGDAAIDPDRWTLPSPPEVPPVDAMTLLRQLLDAQKEQVLWARRTAGVVRELRDVPFWWLVKVFVKVAFALIPAAIIVAIIWAVINAIIAGTIAALIGLLLIGGSSGTRVQPTAAPRAPAVAPAIQASNNQSADAKYLADVRAIAADYTSAAQESTTLLKYLINDYSLLQQPEWKAKMKAIWPRLRAVIARSRAIQPTPRYQKAHQYWLEFADYTEKGVDAGEIGIDTGDATKLSEAGKHLSNAAIASDAAGKEIERASTAN